MKQYEYKNGRMQQNIAKFKGIMGIITMNLLEFGMKYENSDSGMLRFVAKHILAVEMRRADRCEARLNKTQAAFRRDPEETAALFQSIQNRIAECFPEEGPEEERTAHDHASG